MKLSYYHLIITEQYKRSACDRERARMNNMNKLYGMLQKQLPRCKPPGKRLSKIESLRYGPGLTFYK